MGRIDYRVGCEFTFSDGSHGILTRIIDYDNVEVRLENGSRQIIQRKDIISPKTETADKQIVKKAVDPTEDQIRVAKARLEIIRPLLNLENRTRAMVEKRAQIAANTVLNLSGNEIKLLKKGDVTTIYDWIKRYEERHNLYDLIPDERKGTRNGIRVHPKVEDAIQTCIALYYNTEQKLTPTKLYNKKLVPLIEKINKEDGLSLKVPHINTLYNRLRAIDPELSTRKRNGDNKADEEFGMDKGHFPGADWPWEVVQIDSTPLDVIVVDEKREPIGRPDILVAMDVCTRVVLAFLIIYGKPSAATLALCIGMAMLDKAYWLRKWGINADWDVWGKISTIHVDNALHFHSNAFRKGCEKNEINIEYRPLKNPKYGAHIESFMRTLNNEIHTIPGTTFSNIRDKGEYNSEKHAVLTDVELDKWVANYILRNYNHSEHSTLKDSPMNVYKKMIVESGNGLPAKLTGNDERNLMLDFMPKQPRKIQADGVKCDTIRYNSSALRPFRKRRVFVDKKWEKPDFIFVQNPMDISVLHFYDDDKKDYIDIPSVDPRLPPTTLEEYKNAKAKKGKRCKVTSEDVKASEIENDNIVANAKKSKAARKRGVRRKRECEDAQALRKPNSTPADEPSSTPADEPKVAIDLPDTVPPYGDTELW